MKKLLIAISLFISAFFLFLYFTTPPPVEPTTQPVQVVTQPLNRYAIHDEINEYRVSQGKRPLMFDDTLCDFAKERLYEIHTDWSHDGFWEVETKYPYIEAGENLAYGQTSPEELVRQWVASPKHLENILKPYTRTCIETNIYNNTTYTVQQFVR